jgi:hypothetical protein
MNRLYPLVLFATNLHNLPRCCCAAQPTISKVHAKENWQDVADLGTTAGRPVCMDDLQEMKHEFKILLV